MKTTKEALKKAIQAEDMMQVKQVLKDAPNGTTVVETCDGKTLTYTKENGEWLAPKELDCDGRDFTTSSDLAEEWCYGAGLSIR